MARSKGGELCPFCGLLFATGILRGRHIRTVHRTALSEILSDCDQAGFEEQRELADDERKLQDTLRESVRG